MNRPEPTLEDGTVDRIEEIVASLPDRWQQPFTIMVLDNRSQRQACDECGVRRGSIARWATTEKWRRAARDLRRILTAQRYDRWLHLQALADVVIEEVLTDDEAEDKDRLRAAELVYDRSGLTAGKTLVDPDAAQQDAPSPHTAEGREALVRELAAAMPADLLLEAARRRQAAAPAHLREPSTTEEP